MKNQKFAQAKKFYNENKENLLRTLLKEQTGEIDYQSEYDQVAVWFDGFSLCYQNSDMNGAGKGYPHWNNPGADSGVDELRDMLAADARFQPLIAEDESWPNEWLNTLVQDFCAEFEEKNNIAGYFANEEEANEDDDRADEDD
jgi:hypothetical protein